MGCMVQRRSSWQYRKSLHPQTFSQPELLSCRVTCSSRSKIGLSRPLQHRPQHPLSRLVLPQRRHQRCPFILTSRPVHRLLHQRTHRLHRRRFLLRQMRRPCRQQTHQPLVRHQVRPISRLWHQRVNRVCHPHSHPAPLMHLQKRPPHSRLGPRLLSLIVSGSSTDQAILQCVRSVVSSPLQCQVAA